jgi:virulence-associated protein VapD
MSITAQPSSFNGYGHNSTAGKSMFAIVFDLDTATLEQLYRNPSWRNAYVDVANTLARHGFTRMQGSTYFGDMNVDAVRCVLAVQDLTRNHDWYQPAVRDIRMLRIEDNNDLMPAIEAVGPR